MRVVLIVVAVLALVGFLAVAVVLPMMADAEAREAAQALLAGSDAAKKQIAAAAEKTKSLDGAGAGIKLTPIMQSGKVSWRCRGYPNRAMPADCGGR